MKQNYIEKNCANCGEIFEPRSGNSRGCSKECKRELAKQAERARDFKKSWGQHRTVTCSNCKVVFSTCNAKRKYCGNIWCERQVSLEKRNRAEKNRSSRSEYKASYYQKNRDTILDKKRKYYDGSKSYTVRRGHSTAPLTISEIREPFIRKGYKVVSETHKNTTCRIQLICPEGHHWSSSYHNFVHNNNSCYRCQQFRFQSEPELEIISYFRREFPNLELIESAKVLSGSRLELDLYFPEKKVAVEYCGLYWHDEDHKGGDRKYHYNKMKMCNDNGIRLITIFEDEYINRPEIVISRIKVALGVITDTIYARKCNIRVITPSEAGSFMDAYHLQGRGPTKYRAALLHKGHIVQVMTLGSIGRAHTSNKGTVELKRLASLPDVIVVGGASKLFKNCILWAKSNQYTSLKSYCDMRWANQMMPVYEKLNFKLVTGTTHTPHYYKGQKRYRNFSLRKTPEERLTGKTEWELRKEQGYGRIWDCGHRTYEYRIV